MGEQDAAVFVFRVLVQIFILPCEKVRQRETEEGDRARIQIFLAWIDNDRLTSRKCFDILYEEIEAEKEGASCRFVEEIAVQTGKPPDGTRLADLVVVVGSLSIGDI